jgi:hypothetical protein
LLRVLYFLLLCAAAANAVVTIAPVVIGDKPGFSAKLQASLETKRGNTESDTYGGGLRLSYDNNSSYVIWSELSANYAKASGTTNTNNTFVHIRYIHTLPIKKLDYETFVQSQTNEFTKIAERALAGGGFRLHLRDKQLGDLFFGAGAFYEYIRYTSALNPDENNIRLNFYISYVKTLIPGSKFSYIAYYQPKVDQFSDYFISNAAQLSVHIYKQLFLSFEILYDRDSKPAIGVKKDDFTQNTSLIYSF